MSSRLHANIGVVGRLEMLLVVYEYRSVKGASESVKNIPILMCNYIVGNRQQIIERLRENFIMREADSRTRHANKSNPVTNSFRSDLRGY